MADRIHLSSQLAEVELGFVTHSLGFVTHSLLLNRSVLSTQDEFSRPCEPVRKFWSNNLSLVKLDENQLLWEEYKAAHPSDGLQYSRCCDLYRALRERLDLSRLQTHKTGEKVFVDYCGPTVAVVDAQTGARRSTQIFVVVLGASHYTYAEATWTQRLPDWTGSHERALPGQEALARR